jgi:hypothetical protein
VLARVIIFATRRELVDKLVDRQIAIARKKGRKKERKLRLARSCGVVVIMLSERQRCRRVKGKEKPCIWAAVHCASL